MEKNCLQCKLWDMSAKENGYASGMCEKCFNKLYVSVDLKFSTEFKNRNVSDSP